MVMFQKAVAHTLGLPSSKVMCRCKRLGKILV